MSLRTRSLRWSAAGLLLAGAQAQAANPQFQDFFFTVCTAPSGALAARCAETPGGLGNLSGDSESSLNPSQNLGHNQPALGAALGRSKGTRERAEHLRNSDSAEPEAQGGRLSALINVRASDFGRDGLGPTDPERGFEGDSRALEIGFDYALSPAVLLGAMLGIERMDNEFDPENPGVNFLPAPLSGASETDVRHATVFGAFAIGNAGFIEIAAGYEKQEGTYQRFSVFQESTRTIPQTNVRTEADADGTTRWVSINAGFDVHRGAFSFGSFLGFTRTQSKIDGYSERDLSNSGLAMTFAEAKRDSSLGHVGVRASYAYSSGVGVFIPQLRVEHQKEFDDDPQTISAQFVLDPLGTQYQLVGDRIDTSATEAGFSLSLLLPNGWMPFLDYDVLVGSSGRDRQRATLGLRVEF